MDKSERDKLNRLYGIIRAANNKKETVKLVYNDSNSKAQISYTTSVKEVDVITFERKNNK